MKITFLLTFLGLGLPCLAQYERLGIGTNDPKSTLNIYNSGYSNILQLYNQGNEEIFSIKNDGKISVGNAGVANAHLHLKHNFGISLLSLVQANSTSPVGISFSNNNGLAWQINSHIPATSIFPDATWKIDYFPVGNLLTFRGNGATGIRKTNPIYALDINGSLGLSGKLMPNGNEGQVGQVLVSEGPNKPPIWKSFLSERYQRTIYQQITNTGIATSSSSITVHTLSFSITDTTMAEVVFNLDIQCNSVGIASSYALVELELWKTSTNTLIETHKLYTDVYNENNAYLTPVNSDKVFRINPPFPGLSELYELRLKIRKLEGDDIRYGHGGSLIVTPPSSKFISLYLIKK